MATITATIAAAEVGADVFSASVAVASSVGLAGGTLAGLAADFAATRGASGLFLGATEVLACAINATRFYGGWATLTDVTAAPGPFAITGATIVTTDEWAIIAPLFRLYVERESAIVLEASRGLGAELVGRGSSEVASEIQLLEAGLPQLAFVEEVSSLGYPAA